MVLSQIVHKVRKEDIIKGRFENIFLLKIHLNKGENDDKNKCYANFR